MKSTCVIIETQKNEILFRINDKTKKTCNSEKFIKKNYKELYDDLYKWEFPDDFDFTKKLYHYIHNDKKLQIGLCKMCGKRCKFHRLYDGYSKYCSSKCSQNDKDLLNRIKQTKLERYGDANYNNRESALKTYKKIYGNGESISKKIKQTKLEKYGDANYNNKEKWKITWDKKSEDEKNEIRQHHRNSVLQKSKHELERIGKKISETKHKNFIIKNNDIIKYNDNGDYVCACSNKNCSLCEEKQYIINPKKYYARKKLGVTLCTKLNEIGVHSSFCENEILSFVESIYKGNVVKRERTLLNGKEIDIYIPDKNLAIEFNGIYWHSEIYKETNYHYDKSISCLNKGVQLIHVWEDDWLNKHEIVKNLIRGKLGLFNNKINARQCTIRNIETKTARNFCEKYHIQGYTNSLVKLGLFYENNLVMVALFGKGRKISGSGEKEGEWELYRLCSIFNTVVRGGASKLIKHFVLEKKPKNIITFADISVSNGNLYEKIGFNKLYYVKPSYFWCFGNIRYTRYKFQKTNLIECKQNSNLTEDCVMRNRGYYKLYDAGKIKYELKLC